MPKETSIPLKPFDQKMLLLRGVAFFSVVLIISGFCFKFMTFVTYPHPSSRIPEYSDSIFIIPFLLFLIGYSVLYLLGNKIYHFELHPDILIITSKTVFNKKRDFFYIKQINSISIQKERPNTEQDSSLLNYKVTSLSIQSLDKDLVKYSFFPSIYELKGLKELLKDFI
jgi:hypothetical protein